MTDAHGGPEGADRLAPDEIRTLFLFESLDPDKVDWLAEHGRVEQRRAGEMVYVEGEDATCFYVLLDGTIVMRRRVGDDEIEVARTNQRGVYGGADQAYLQSTEPRPYPGSMQAITDSRFFVLPASEFGAIFAAWFPMAMHLLEGIFLGMRSSQAIVGQRERLLGLGRLTAGLTHELNNPAAAAVRATSSLRERVAMMRHKLAALADGRLNADDLIQLASLQEEAVEMLAKQPKLTPMQASDAEEVVEEWLDEPWRAGQLGDRRDAQRRRHRPGLAGPGRRGDPGDPPRGWAALDHLHPRHRAADARDRGRHPPDLLPRRSGQAVLPARPGRTPGHRRAGRAGQHAGHDERQAQGRRHHGGQGLRRRPARHPGLPGRAQPGLDQPDRQRDRGDGGARHPDPAHGAGPATTSWSRSATPARACRRRTSSGSSSRSSRPSRSARAPASGWTSRIALSCNDIGATCGSSPSRATPASRCSCR